MAHSSLRVEFDTVFDQTCFNRLATHINISMFGHQTMFDDVWSPNISRLDRPLSGDSFTLLEGRSRCFHATKGLNVKHIFVGNNSGN